MISMSPRAEPREASGGRSPERSVALAGAGLAALLVLALMVGVGPVAFKFPAHAPIAASVDATRVVDVPDPAGEGPASPSVVDESGTSMRPFEAQLIEGLVGMRVYSTHSGGPIAARWAYLPGDHPVNAEIDAWIRAQLDAHGRDYGEGAYHPRAGTLPGGLGADRTCSRGGSLRPLGQIAGDLDQLPPIASGDTGLVISCDIIVANGDAYGIRLRASELADDGLSLRVLSDVTQTFFADLGGRETGVGADLVAEPQGTRVTAIVADALSALPIVKPTGHPPTLRSEIDDAALLHDVAFGPSGELIVRLAPDLIEGGRLGDAPIEVRIPPVELAGAFSPLGVAARTAVANGEAWNGEARPAGLNRLSCDLVPCVGLTFDDGPGPYTGAILDAFDAAHATGSFFVLGERVRAEPDVVKRMAEEGHVIGNHTYSHMNFSINAVWRIQDELRMTNEAVEAAAGVRPKYMRPPWAIFFVQDTKWYGLPVVLWTADSKDWKDPGVGAIVQGVMRNAVPGAIILFHDTHAGTAQAMPDILEQLESEGYYVAGLDDLIGHPTMTTVTMHGQR